jgi:hypothetical protein
MRSDCHCEQSSPPGHGDTPGIDWFGREREEMIMASGPAATWKPPSQSKQESGDLDAADRNELPDSAYAFPKQRKEPLNSASHVRNAIARFDQVKDVSDDDRAQAFANIKAAASHFDVDLTEQSWHDLMH